MAREFREHEDLLQPDGGLPMGRENGAQAGNNSSRHFARCAECLQIFDATAGEEYCASCETRVSTSATSYSGQAPELVTGHDHFDIKTVQIPAPRRPKAKRRFARIPCRNVKACVKTDEAAGAVVDVVTLSRGGLCFVSFERFAPGTRASIAMHYIEGGQNIFQEGRIVWVGTRSSNCPTAYGVEFSPHAYPGTNTH